MKHVFTFQSIGTILTLTSKGLDRLKRLQCKNTLAYNAKAPTKKKKVRWHLILVVTLRTCNIKLFAVVIISHRDKLECWLPSVTPKVQHLQARLEPTRVEYLKGLYLKGKLQPCLLG